MLIPLRNYSNYSICESNIKIDDLVNFAEKEKLPAMALTDYKLLSGALEFSTKCKNKGIQPIIGLDVDYISKLNHKSRLTFLCKNEIGFKNLNILSTKINYKISMKYYYLIFISILFSCDNIFKNKSIFVGGNIINPSSKFVLIYKNEEMIDTIFLDEENKFSKSVDNENFQRIMRTSLEQGESLRSNGFKWMFFNNLDKTICVGTR